MGCDVCDIRMYTSHIQIFVRMYSYLQIIVEFMKERNEDLDVNLSSIRYQANKGSNYVLFFRVNCKMITLFLILFLKFSKF